MPIRYNSSSYAVFADFKVHITCTTAGQYLTHHDLQTAGQLAIAI
jgi:hypothetical protein